MCGVFLISSLAKAAVEAPAPIVFIESLKKKELFEILNYPARIVPKVTTTILSEIDGVVRRIHSPLVQRVKRKARVMTIFHTDPVYQYAPVSVIAPVAGIVSSVEVTEGSQVAKGQKLVTVTDPSKVSLTVEVPGRDCVVRRGRKMSRLYASPLRVYLCLALLAVMGVYSRLKLPISRQLPSLLPSRLQVEEPLQGRAQRGQASRQRHRGPFSS